MQTASSSGEREQLSMECSSSGRHTETIDCMVGQAFLRWASWSIWHSLLQRCSCDASTGLHCMFWSIALSLWQAVLAMTSTTSQTCWHPELVATASSSKLPSVTASSVLQQFLCQNRLATKSVDGRMCVWDMAARKQLSSWKVSNLHCEPPSCTAYGTVYMHVHETKICSCRLCAENLKLSAA